MATKSPIKTALGKRVSKLIKQTPWAFTPEGLQDALQTQRPSQKIKINSVRNILDKLESSEQIKRVNGNGYRTLTPDITPETIHALIQLNYSPVHHSFFMGHVATTTARKAKLNNIIQELKDNRLIREDNGFYTSTKPAANSAYVRLSRNKKYAHILNWQDETISPYITIPPSISKAISGQNSTDKIALVRLARTMSRALTVKEILPKTGIVARFTEVAKDIARIEPVDYKHSGTFIVDIPTSPIKPKIGDLVLASHYKEASLAGAKMRIIGFTANNECFSSIDLFEHRRTCATPDSVEEQAEIIANILPTAHTITRDKKFKDLSHEPFFTVDPHNKQDIDDALCFKQNKDGSLTVYVAIANVAAQIPFGSELDLHRRQHPMAIFLANGAHHTMPHSLYNAQDGTLSLCESHKRHALVHKFTIPENLTHLNEIEMDVFPAFIRSRKALSYSEFAEALHFPEILEDKDIVDSMDLATRFVTQLQFLIGSLPFDSRKLRLSFNDAGELDNYLYRPSDTADQVIELSALLTNRKSTELILNYNDRNPENPLPLIFRTQDAPNKQDLLEAIEQINNITPGLIDDRMPGELNHYGEKSDGYTQIARNLIETTLMRCKDEMTRSFISKTLLRSTRRAIYSTEEQQHFSLDTVTGHVTSPLRRYVDTIGQWSTMKASGIAVQDLDLTPQELSSLAKFSSDEEDVSKLIQKNSTQRHLIDYFNQNKKEPITNARISTIREDGVVIDVDRIEGFISRVDLPRAWQLDPETQTLKSFDTGRQRIIGLGDTLPIHLLIKEACPFSRSLKFGDAANTTRRLNSTPRERAFA